jgi:hypothetical protein
MCFTLGSSIAEIVSAFPTCGGLYTASAQLVPKQHRARVRMRSGWLLVDLLKVFARSGGLLDGSISLARLPVSRQRNSVSPT